MSRCKNTTSFPYRLDEISLSIQWKLRTAENRDWEDFKQKSLQSHILQEDHKGSLEDAEVTLIIKTRGSVAATSECCG